MNIWIINPYGNIPGEDWRTYRTTLIANAFAAEGHQVVSWVSNIQHRSKELRATSWKDVQVNDHYLIKIVPSVPYQKHISWARIQYERTYARNLKQYVQAQSTLAQPDLIILGEPALFISDIILDVVKLQKCPLIVDVLDLWPELFSILLPKKLSFLARLIFAPLYYKRKKLFQKADGLMAVAKDYLALAQRDHPQAPSAVVYCGLELNEIKVDPGDKFENKILQQLIKMPNQIWVVYAGTLGPNYDIQTIVACAKLLAVQAPHVQFIIAGDGELRNLVNQPQANLVYVGSLSSKDVTLLYQQCDIGLSSYVDGSTVSMPLKAYDYFAAGLPLVNSLHRDLGNFVAERNVGLQYEAEDPAAMAAAIMQLANDENLRKKMRINALSLADDFDAKIQYEKVLRLAEKVVNNK
jgi:glycosyltransferase involved in cell wall biosynthesis